MMRRIVFVLVMVLLVQGCSPAQTEDGGRTAANDATPAGSPPSTVMPTPLPTETPAPVNPEPSPTPAPSVMITAVDGNLYIRRGPGLPYNQIGILKNGDSAAVIGQDVLGRWVQIEIPGSARTGWVSIMTTYSLITGDLSAAPDFTFTDYPLPAYIKNCTEHDLWVEPGDLYVYNLYANASGLNEIQVNPGVYYVYDISVEGLPLADRVEVKEGMTAYVTVNGLGEKHKCP